MDFMRILHLLQAIDDGDNTRQLRALLPGLCERDSVEICCLGPESAWSAALRQIGVPVHVLGWTRWFDPAIWLHLRDVLHESAPDAIHVWDLPALRALAVCGTKLLPRVVTSEMLAEKSNLAWWDRRLLERVRRLAHAPCAVRAVVQPKPATPGPIRISFAGRLERASGVREAIWAFDILLLLYPDAQLHIVGDGPDRDVLRDLTCGLHSAASVHFVSAPIDPTPVLGDADIVWIPSLTDRGRQTALDAMVLGKPVVASDVPCLRTLIRDGETGYLTPRGDVIALARRTRALLQDAPLRDRIGQAARVHAHGALPIGAAVEHWCAAYRSVA
jgi:glycosyltransferase involved in cell wall biosynthesis